MSLAWSVMNSKALLWTIQVRFVAAKPTWPLQGHARAVCSFGISAGHHVIRYEWLHAFVVIFVVELRAPLVFQIVVK